MALVTVIVTGLVLILIQHRLRAQVIDDFSVDLEHSVVTFQNLQAERFDALNRENALLAELPTLKALMTSGDRLTIQDGAVEFWQLSGEDLFALADSAGNIVAVYTSAGSPDASLHRALQALIASSNHHYLVVGNSLYDCSLRPLYFGSDRDGTLLGYVISGNSIERTVGQISGPTGVHATFVSDGQRSRQHANQTRPRHPFDPSDPRRHAAIAFYHKPAERPIPRRHRRPFAASHVTASPRPPKILRARGAIDPPH